MSVTLQNRSDEVSDIFTKISKVGSEKALRKKYPAIHKAYSILRGTVAGTAEEIFSWTNNPLGTVARLKNRILKLSKFLPFPVGLHFLGIKEENLTPPVSARKPYIFTTPTEKEKKEFKKKANKMKLIYKIMMISGVILLGAGVVLPLLSSLFLIFIPEGIAFCVIAALTLFGITGVVTVVASMFFRNGKAVRESRVKTNQNFQEFVKTYIQENNFICKSKARGAGFNLCKENILDNKLHKIFLDWKKKMKKNISQKNIIKVKSEYSHYLRSKTH